MLKDIFLKSAKRQGLKIQFEGKRKGFLIAKNGKRIRFDNYKLSMNTAKAVKLCRDKHACVKQLSKDGIVAPETIMLPQCIKNLHSLEPYIAQAITSFIEKVGFPVFVKPNNGSEGKFVYRVDGLDALKKSVFKISKSGSDVLIQQACYGTEYRIVVLNGNVVLAYKKEPLMIIGDGQSTINTLIGSKLKSISKRRKLSIKHSSPKIDFALHAQGLSRDTILKHGEKIYPIPTANLAQGAQPSDATEFIKREYGHICQKIAYSLGASFIGIDFMVEEKSGNYSVIEVNSKLGFSKYAASGDNAQNTIISVYEKCIRYKMTG
jgi:D-alanine-D-alanine ligase-like ATP-grasp enzyme